MADLLQSSATTATQAPSYYNTYLTNLATNSQTAADAAEFAGAQPLQTAAFADVSKNVGNYLPALTTAQGTLGQATATSPLSAANPYFQNANVDPSQLAEGYMSPYTKDVVNSIGTLGQRNIQQNLAPQAVAGAVGSGQFGSQRGAQVLGQTIQNANTDILAQRIKPFRQAIRRLCRLLRSNRRWRLNWASQQVS
jgi:murein tripeptide amidase MpaA